MSHGLPDYYRGVDIAYQALAEMIVRPKYGGALSEVGNVAVTASAETVLVSISGKGMIYGGGVMCNPVNSQMNSQPKLVIDGETVFQQSYNMLAQYGIDTPRSFPVSLTKFEDATRWYCACISYGLTFETGVKVSYVETHGNTPTVGYVLCYALV